MAKIPLQFLWLHSANYWFEFGGYNGTYRNCEKNSLFVVDIRYTDQPMRLRNITPAALHLWIYQIHYTDMIYIILVTGD